jgi:phytoene dehydrogenase-like protein
MADKSLIIIGAGIAGLAAGCYGQMNGYHTEIFEMQALPGGLCTAWKRKGYTFDGCLHWLMGTSPRSGFYQLWTELGVTQTRRMIAHDEFIRVVGSDGRAFVLYSDFDRLEQHMKELSPADAPVIDEFIADMRLFSQADIWPENAPELMTPADAAKLAARAAPYMVAIEKWSKISAAEFAARFQDPFLRAAFPIVIFGPATPMLFYFFTLSGMSHGDCGVPEGGSLEFARAIEQRYLALGGQIHYGCRVAKILVEEKPAADGQPGGRATGILLEDGRTYHADDVISAADGHTTLFSMLEGKFVSDEFRGYYQDMPVVPGVVQVSLGINRDLSSEPHASLHLLDAPVTIGGRSVQALSLRHFCYDKTMAPEGKSVVETIVGSNYDYWKQVAQDAERYEAEKQQAATAVIDQLERHYPGITADIEVVDVATPLTTEEYTGNWQGSIMGWFPFGPKAAAVMQHGMSKTLPGLEDFYMIGQWVQPLGGVPGVAPTGRHLIQILCARDGKPFVTDIPV